MHEKWFVSDTHFFHANILKFVGGDGKHFRVFDDVDHMNETMVANWNSVVRDNDYVYHLGDVTFSYGKEFNSLMSRLKGRKRLILGNHDKIKGTNLMDWFEKVELWKGFKEHNFTASHFKLLKGSQRDGEFNLHGHTHQNVDPDPFYINNCVENTNYTPRHIDEIVEIIKDRS